MKKLILLDRDGVINNDLHGYIKSPEEWTAIPGSLEAIAQLNRAGFNVVVVTNQSGIARGYYDVTMLDLIHEKMRLELAKVHGHIDGIYICPHHPDDQCDCRKPKPGLLNQIQKKYQVDWADVFFIGDTLTDIQTAHVVGCKPVLVLTGNGKKALTENPDLSTVLHFENLAAAAKYIIGNQQ